MRTIQICDGVTATLTNSNAEAYEFASKVSESADRLMDAFAHGEIAWEDAIGETLYAAYLWAEFISA